MKRILILAAAPVFLMLISGAAVFFYLRAAEAEPCPTIFPNATPHPALEIFEDFVLDNTYFHGSGDETLILLLYEGVWSMQLSVRDNERCNGACFPSDFTMRIEPVGNGSSSFIFDFAPVKEFETTETIIVRTARQVPSTDFSLLAGAQFITIEADGTWGLYFDYEGPVSGANP